MGQRLNIEIVNGETSLANCYYHWSAYTVSALELTRRIIRAYYDSKSIVGLKMAVELLEATGGGVSELERAGIQKCAERFGHIKFRDATSRNDGLISVTEEGKDETREWEEGCVTIDLNSETFKFDVVWYATPEDFEEPWDEDDDLRYEDLEECECNLDAIPFTEIENFIDLVSSHPDGFRVKGEEVAVRWIC